MTKEGQLAAALEFCQRLAHYRLTEEMGQGTWDEDESAESMLDDLIAQARQITEDHAL